MDRSKAMWAVGGRMSRRLLSCVAVMAGLCVPACADPVLFSQPAMTGTGALSNTQQPVAYDNFSLASTAQVLEVQWSGNIAPSGPNPTGFSILIFTNGSPSFPVGAQIYQATIAGDANQTADSTLAGVYDYSAAINFTATGGTEYWLAILAQDPTYSWSWQYGIGGDNYRVVQTFATLTPYNNDLAFTLLDQSPVPEPGSIALLGTGMIAVLGASRWRPKDHSKLSRV